MTQPKADGPGGCEHADAGACALCYERLLRLLREGEAEQVALRAERDAERIAKLHATTRQAEAEEKTAYAQRERDEARKQAAGQGEREDALLSDSYACERAARARADAAEARAAALEAEVRSLRAVIGLEAAETRMGRFWKAHPDTRDYLRAALAAPAKDAGGQRPAAEVARCPNVAFDRLRCLRQVGHEEDHMFTRPAEFKPSSEKPISPAPAPSPETAMREARLFDRLLDVPCAMEVLAAQPSPEKPAVQPETATALGVCDSLKHPHRDNCCLNWRALPPGGKP